MSDALLLARVDALAKAHGLALARIERLESEVKRLAAARSGVTTVPAHSDDCRCIFCAARRMVALNASQ